MDLKSQLGELDQFDEHAAVRQRREQWEACAPVLDCSEQGCGNASQENIPLCLQASRC